MKAPLSWIKDFVDVKIPVTELAQLLTMAGLEVESIQIIGLPMPANKDENGAGRSNGLKISGLSWDPEKIVTAAVYEVEPHPNADRLVLCRLDDGQQIHTVLTGAPNLYPYKGIGPLEKPLKVAYAKEGARIYDGHQPGQVLTTLKRAKIRGVESYSMICSEKELGVSEEHEGVIILDDDAPVGVPLVDYMGDAVLEISIIPNVARAASILGVAREAAALMNQPLHNPDYKVKVTGPSIQGKARIEIRNPELNPRFTLGLVEGVEVHPSPYWVQRRLRLAGMRPINNVVDATNYAMLEIGQPLHAFDYDVLKERAGGKEPTIITRTAEPGEHLITLDGVDHALDPFNVLVCDTAGALSIAGVMGGEESEIRPTTRNILLEGAAWNFINIRRTASSQKNMSEAAYRYSRGVHPAMASRGVLRCQEFMRQWANATIYEGLIDEYPLPPENPVITITPADARRWLGIELSTEELADSLRRLEFPVEIQGESVLAKAPDHRLDIGSGIVGVADLMEEVARIYGYDRIPETMMETPIPMWDGDPNVRKEDHIRDLLVDLGMQEVTSYRMTTPEREARCLPPGAPTDERPYIRLANPIASDRTVMRHSLIPGMLEIIERNNRIRERMAIFEMGPVFILREGEQLPDETLCLALALTGPRDLPSWQGADTTPMDFYDMKGILEELLSSLHVGDLHWTAGDDPRYHPGQCAKVSAGDQPVALMGRLHPQVTHQYELPATPVLLAEIDLQAVLNLIQDRYTIDPVPVFPPVLEDIAVVVDENVPAEKIEATIRQAGGKMVSQIRLFDIFRGPQIGVGKKSMAYNLTYQAADRTLTDKEAAQVRQRILRRLEQEIGAKLRA